MTTTGTLCWPGLLIWIITLATFPFTRLASSGEAVGLPANQMGNSEVGHLNLGAGRIVYQDILRISRAIEDGSFFSNDALLEAMERVRDKGSSLHLMGLLSDGGIHSHNTHLYALLKLAARYGLRKVFIHAILDGRDTPPSSAAVYLGELEEEMSRLGTGKLASVAGRYWTMDRDKRWNRTEKAYLLYTKGQGRRAKSSLGALEKAYGEGETDEFVLPTAVYDETNKPIATIGRMMRSYFSIFGLTGHDRLPGRSQRKNLQSLTAGSAPRFLFLCP